MNNYGDFFKEQRITAKKTLTDVEKATGISNENLSRWENNKNLPNIDFCVLLADYYDISLDELVGRDSISMQKKFLSTKTKSEIQEVYDELDELEQAQVLSFAKTLASYKKNSLLSTKRDRNIG